MESTAQLQQIKVRKPISLRELKFTHSFFRRG